MYPILPIQVWSWKIFEQSGMFSLNVEEQKCKSSKWQVIVVFDILRRTKEGKWKKDKDTVQSTYFAEYISADGSMKFVTGEDLELWYLTCEKAKSKEQYVRNWRICDEKEEGNLQEAFLRVLFWEIFDELSRRKFLRKI